VVELDSEKRVSYEAFVPVMWDLLVETLKSNYLASSQGELFDYLRDLCTAADLAQPAQLGVEEGAERQPSGMLSRADLKRVLLGCDRISLTPLQVYTVLAEAEEDEEHGVEYGKFLLRAVPLVQHMCSPLLAKQRADAAERAQLTPVEVLGGQDREAMNGKLRQIFQSYDADGDGLLSRAEFAKCLRNADLALSVPQISALFAASDLDKVRHWARDPRPARRAARPGPEARLKRRSPAASRVLRAIGRALPPASRTGRCRLQSSSKSRSTRCSCSRGRRRCSTRSAPTWGTSRLAGRRGCSWPRARGERELVSVGCGQVPAAGPPGLHLIFRPRPRPPGATSPPSAGPSLAASPSSARVKPS
jgi:hypothetical protein